MPKKKVDKGAYAVVGGFVREVRMRHGVSQEALGEAIGVTFQQVQKNERGENRLPLVSFIRGMRALGQDPAVAIAELERRMTA